MSTDPPITTRKALSVRDPHQALESSSLLVPIEALGGPSSTLARGLVKQEFAPTP